MNQIPFAKVQSIGNDFVLFRAEDVAGRALPALSEHVCRRHFSIGSDGMLVLGQDANRLHLRMFNPDGSEDFCGNGLRSAAWFAAQEGWFTGDISVLHLGRRVAVHVGEDGLVSSSFGPASFAPESIPSLGPELFESLLSGPGFELRVSSLSTGSAHTVAFVEKLPDDDTFLRVSPLVEHHPMFPERTSLMWTQILSPSEIIMRIWERGAGETLGCGTGSVAAAIAYLRREDRGGTVHVHNPGGVLAVSADSWSSEITTRARAEVVFRGEVYVPEPILNGGR